MQLVQRVQVMGRLQVADCGGCARRLSSCSPLCYVRLSRRRATCRPRPRFAGPPRRPHPMSWVVQVVVRGPVQVVARWVLLCFVRSLLLRVARLGVWVQRVFAALAAPVPMVGLCPSSPTVRPSSTPIHHAPLVFSWSMPWSAGIVAASLPPSASSMASAHGPGPSLSPAWLCAIGGWSTAWLCAASSIAPVRLHVIALLCLLLTEAVCLLGSGSGAWPYSTARPRCARAPLPASILHTHVQGCPLSSFRIFCRYVSHLCCDH